MEVPNVAKSICISTKSVLVCVCLCRWRICWRMQRVQHALRRVSPRCVCAANMQMQSHQILSITLQPLPLRHCMRVHLLNLMQMLATRGWHTFRHPVGSPCNDSRLTSCHAWCMLFEPLAIYHQHQVLHYRALHYIIILFSHPYFFENIATS